MNEEKDADTGGPREAVTREAGSNLSPLCSPQREVSAATRTCSEQLCLPSEPGDPPSPLPWDAGVAGTGQLQATDGERSPGGGRRGPKAQRSRHGPGLLLLEPEAELG